jgi:hypothetical protein
MLELAVLGAAVAAPGLDSWADALPVLAGTAPYRPQPLARYQPERLPATERRRASASTRLAFQVAEAALSSSGEADGMATVFASAFGDTEIVHQICEALAGPELAVSPTRFHNSVHNAPAGYWSIATAAMGPSTSIAAADATFGAGLLAAAVQAGSEATRVLLVVYDLPFPAPLDAKRPAIAPFATALVLAPPTAGAMAILRLATTDAGTPESVLADPPLDALRRGNPAARGLPLLCALAAGRGDTLGLTLPTGMLRVEVRPCS